MVTERRKLELENITEIESMINKSVKEEKESKELFSKEDIEVKTDVDLDETSSISRLLFLCDELELDNFRKALKYLMQLRLSKGRKSRKEYIDSIKKEQLLGINGGQNLGGFQNGRLG